MKVEIDDRRLKQLYNIESWCKEELGIHRDGYPVAVGIKALGIIKDTLKPISNRPTLDELAGVYKVYTCTTIPMGCKKGLKAVIEKVFDGVERDAEDGPSLYNTFYKHRDGYEKDMADD